MIVVSMMPRSHVAGCLSLGVWLLISFRGPGIHNGIRTLSALWSRMFRGYPARAARPAIGPESRSGMGRDPGSVGRCWTAKVQHPEGSLLMQWFHSLCSRISNVSMLRRTLELLSSNGVSWRKPKLCRLNFCVCVISDSRSWRC